MNRLWQWMMIGALTVVIASGCGQRGAVDDPPLVAIGEHTISAASLQSFEESLPEYVKSSAPDPQARRAHLQSLVDRQIMGIEVGMRDLRGAPDVERSLDRELRDRLISDVLRDSVDEQVHVTGQELRDYFEFRSQGWQVVPAHILLATEADGHEVVRRLSAGADFASLARERSLADDADAGGSLERFLDPGDIAPPVRQVAFQLPLGEVSEPIQTRDGFEVVKILEKRRQPYEHMRADVFKQVHRQKRDSLAAEFYSRLKTRWEVRYHTEHTQAVLAGFEQGGVQAAQEEATLVSWRGGALSVGSILESMRGHPHRPKDSLGVFLGIDRSALRDTLLLLQARAGGRDHDAQMLAWKEAKHESLALELLYEEEVTTQVTIDEQEVRRHYEQHLDTYTSLPGPISMTEVLVDSQQEAQRILAAAQAGEDLAALAHRHSIREQVGKVGGHAYSDSGRMHIESLFDSPYRDALGDSNRTDVGKALGPIKVQGRFSVFRLDAPIELVAVPYEQIRRSIRYRLRKNKEAVRFESFIDSLRQRHTAQTHWFDNNLDEAGVAR